MLLLVIIHVNWIFHYKPSINWGISIYGKPHRFCLFHRCEETTRFHWASQLSKNANTQDKATGRACKKVRFVLDPRTSLGVSSLGHLVFYYNNHLLNTLIVSGYRRIDQVSSCIRGIWLTKQIQAYWASNIYWTSFIMSLFELAIWFCLQHGILDKHTQILLFSHQLF